MQVSELIRQLQTFQKVHGDLQVRLWTDHAHTPMSTQGAGVGYIDEDIYMPESLSEEDEDFDEMEKIKICEVYAQ